MPATLSSWARCALAQVSREDVGEFRYTGREPVCRASFVWRLEQYVRERSAAGLPWGAGGWVFSPQSRDRGGFDDRPYDSDACNKRLEGHLQRYGLDEGETVHSLRRGYAHDLAASGVAPEEAMAVLGMRSRRTYDLYSDSARPTRG